ncbi:hypothetical protein LSAT2_023237 [Lamellibrachia satsuma]|nr:hypothetical protein LSAT2_023237 [Lamellibrachia satsuma]
MTSSGRSRYETTMLTLPQPVLLISPDIRLYQYEFIDTRQPSTARLSPAWFLSDFTDNDNTDGGCGVGGGSGDDDVRRSFRRGGPSVTFMTSHIFGAFGRWRRAEIADAVGPLSQYLIMSSQQISRREDVPADSAELYLVGKQTPRRGV